MFYLPLRDQWILQNMLAKPLSIEYRVSDCTRFIRWLWRGCLGLGRWLMGSRESICCCSRHRGLRVHDRKKFEQVLSVLVRQLPVQSGNCRGHGYIHACKSTIWFRTTTSAESLLYVCSLEHHWISSRTGWLVLFDRKHTVPGLQVTI